MGRLVGWLLDGLLEGLHVDGRDGSVRGSLHWVLLFLSDESLSVVGFGMVEFVAFSFLLEDFG